MFGGNGKKCHGQLAKWCWFCTRERVGVMIGTSDALNFNLLPATPLGDNVTLAKSLPLSGPHFPQRQTRELDQARGSPRALPVLACCSSERTQDKSRGGRQASFCLNGKEKKPAPCQRASPTGSRSQH